MKRKGQRDIPDFSRKAPSTPKGPATKMNKPAPPSAPVTKPKATSAKGGQRGR